MNRGGIICLIGVVAGVLALGWGLRCGATRPIAASQRSVQARLKCPPKISAQMSDGAKPAPTQTAPMPAKSTARDAGELLAEIPPGALREGLRKLAESARCVALAQLAALKVPREDYASLRVFPGGGLYYFCGGPIEGAAIPAGGTASVPLTTATNPAASVPVSSPPVRHSRASATKVLFLDFNPGTITNTLWNDNRGALSPPIPALPYDSDGDPTQFSDTEQALIIQVWERVAEDFAPFNVDVTTERPATYTATTGRVIITKSVDSDGNAMPRDPYTGEANAGVAFLNVFGNTSYPRDPSLIYYDRLGTVRPDFLADAASHEFGHNLGLSHDGTTAPNAQTYYAGHGTGDTSWGPIMGSPYNRNLTQWSKGEYYLANNTQDDIAIIGAALSFRTDEAGGAPATATVTAVTGTAVSAAGVLSGANDVDVYAVSTAAGAISFTAATYRAATNTNGGNADLKLELLDDAGSILASADHADVTSATLTYAAAAGTYYVRLTPAATGTPLTSTPTGSTNYGSIGQYTVTGTIVPAAPKIVSAATASVAAGAVFSYSVVGTNSPTSYSATGLPAGLSINTTTGVISGRATAAGTFPVSLGADNAIGTGTATLTLTVTNAAPVITAQTTGWQMLATGGAATLSVTPISANGTPTYQWKRNGFTLVGATSSTLAITNATVADSGYYQVLVTNTIGTTASAIIFVRAAPAVTQVVGWGSNSNDQLTFPSGLSNTADVVGGGAHVLALKTDGAVVAWGLNDFGQASVPADLAHVVAVAAGNNHSLALKVDGTVVAWGLNGNGQTSVPVGLVNVVGVVGGGFHSLVLKADGTVAGWGYNYYGEVSEGTTGLPANITNAVAIAAGGFHSLALKADGTVVAWGRNTENQTSVPVGLANVVAIAAGDYFSLALKADGTVVAWGSNSDFQTVVPSGLTGVNSIAGGSAHALASKSIGTAVAWGRTSETQSTVPTGLTGIVAVRAGSLFSLVLRDTAGDTAPSIISQPQGKSVTYGSTATFTVGVLGLQATSYQWQLSTNAGGTWANIVNGGGYAGSTLATLTLTGVTGSLNNVQFRCATANSYGTTTSNAATLLVTQAAQTITFAALADQTYGATPFPVSATSSSGLTVSLAVLSGPATITNGTLTLTGVGTVTLRATQSGDANYTAAPDADHSFTVNRAPLTVVAIDQSRVYGAANPTLTIGYSGFVNNETAAALTSLPVAATTASSASAAGTYAITLSGGSAANYTLTLVSGTLTVTKAPLTVKADNQTRGYGVANPAFTLSYTGFVNGDNSTAITTPTAATTAGTNSNVGTYPITLSGASAANYTLTLSSGTLTITKAAQTISFGALTGKTYGDASFAVSATASSGLSVSFSVVSGPATISGSTLTLNGAGTVTLRASQGGDGNYNAASTVDQSFTAAKAALTATAANQSRTYGSTNPTLGVSYSGFVGADSVASLTSATTATTTAAAASPVGAYAITVSGGSAANYTLTLVGGTLTVTKAPLTIRSDDQSCIINAVIPPLTFSYTGFVNNETSAVLTSVPVASTSATAGSPVGTYPITLTGGTAVNYALTLVNGTLTVTLAPQTITFAAPANKSYGDVFTIIATASSGLRVNFAVISGPANVSGSTVTLTGIGVVTLRASQSGDGTYAAAPNVDQSFTAAKATPVLTWSAPSAITYGTALGSTQLRATANVAGAFTYTPANGSLLAAGTQTLSVTFTPTDTLNYSNATTSTTLTVRKATPALSWPTPDAITYGTTLSSTQLNASSGDIAGTFTYSPTSGAVLVADTQPLSVTFTPNDTANYNSATANTTLTVNQATPALTWPATSSITYGTALGSSQLNVTANVGGTLNYSPASGTVLAAGTQTLSVIFTPTDLANYTTASTSTTLTVNKATPSLTWSASSAITYGTALSATQLNASSGGVSGIFSYTPPSGTLLAAGAQTLSVTFTPNNTANYTTANASTTLTVNKATPSLTWSTPSAITYSAALSSTQLNASSGTVAGNFSYSPANGTVLPTGTQTLSATFTPTDTDNYTSAVKNTTLTVNKATPALTWPTPAAITYGTTLSSTQLNASSGTVAGVFTYNPALGAALNAGTSQTLRVTFTPTDTANYNNSTASTTLTVSKATPALTWSTTSAIIYGTALSATQLNATANVAGTFSYTPAIGTVPNAGANQTLNTTFTPTDTANYTTATASTTLTVSKASPTLTWSTPSAITYGTALNSTQLNASAGGVAGNFSYNPASSTVLTVGTQTLNATFTPANTSNYNGATASTTLTINKATPSLSWHTPLPISVGTALSSLQLNATANVAGIFVYTPALGTVPSAGTLTLGVTFTPTDTANYNPATASTTITVNNKINPALTWSTPTAITYGTALSATQLNATANVPGTFSYTPTAGTLLDAGDQTLTTTFTPVDTTTYNIVTTTTPLTVAPASQSISFGALAGKTFGAASFALSATSSSGLTVSFSIVSGPATIIGNTATITGAGTVVIRASQTGSANYAAAADADQSFTVAKYTPVLNWTAPVAITYGTALSSTQLNATADVAGTFAYTPASGTVPTAGTPTLSVTFTPTDSANYANATTSATLTVAPAAQTITFAALPNKTFGDAPVALSATASSGLAVSFSIVSGPATINGNTVTLTGADTVVIRASQTGSANYTAATPVEQSFTIAKAVATITLGGLATTYNGNAQHATASTNPTSLAVALTYDNSATAPINAGSYAVAANVNEANYQGSASGTLVIAKAAQSITFDAVAGVILGNTPFTVAAISSSSLPVTFSIFSGPATIADNTVTITGAGTVVVRAAQTGNANFSAATPVDQSFAVGKAGQSITFAALANQTYGAAPFALSATASSTLPVAFSIVSGPATITNNTLTLTGAGTVIVRASQSGNANYNPAPDLDHSFTVAQATPALTWPAPSAIPYGTALGSSQLRANANVAGAFAYTPASGTVLNAGASQTLSVAFTPTDSANYATATTSTTLTVTRAPLTATAANQTRLYGAPNPALTLAYAGLVNHDTTAAITATTTALASSPPGTYPITLTGGSASNYTLTLVNGTLTVTPRDYSGTYFGTFASGGHWALYVRRDQTATYLAYLPTRASAVFVQLTVNYDGTFTVTGTEIKPLAAVGALALATPEAPALKKSAAAANFTLTGQIGFDGGLSGNLDGVAGVFAATADTGSAQTPALYQATALGAGTGSTYAIVGPSGQTLVVALTPAGVDGATGTVNSSGRLAATTAANAALTLTIEAQALSASITPAGSSTPFTYGGVADTVTPAAWLSNLSVRAAMTSDQTLIVGFVVDGGAKPMLVRAAGPALNAYGLTGVTDPRLNLFSGSTNVGSNNDWDSALASTFTTLGAFAFANGSQDAALLQSLNGAHTAQATATNAGAILVEAYDAGPNDARKLTNLSARFRVGTGDNILIAGFVVAGTGTRQVLVRAVGPKLADYGVTSVLADPQFTVYDGNTPLATNNDWDSALAPTFDTLGAFQLNTASKDAALLVTLQAGKPYTVQVSGVATTTGEALVELYLLP